MAFIRSIFFNLAFYSWTVFCTILTLFTLPLPFEYGFGLQTIWSKVCQKLLWIVGITVEVRGLENLPKTPALIACQHQSAWETTIFFKVIPRIAVVFKKELLLFPIFGWHLRKMQEIPIDRSSGATAIKKMVRVGKKAIGRGRSVLIFPEGTRTAVGKAGKYHPGVFALYSMLEIPTVPVALNSGLYWPRRKFSKTPGTIIIEFLPPIQTGKGRKEFMALLEKTIENGAEKLIRESQ